jgi:hypothetical protein
MNPKSNMCRPACSALVEALFAAVEAVKHGLDRGGSTISIKILKQAKWRSFQVIPDTTKPAGCGPCTMSEYIGWLWVGEVRWAKTQQPWLNVD